MPDSRTTDGYFPLRTLVEKAAMDSGFDRAPFRTGSLTLFRSTRHPMQIVVDLGNEVLPVVAWLPRSALSLRLLEIAGVALPGSIISLPWKGHDIDPQEQQALVVDGVAPIRRLFRATLKESEQTEETGTEATEANKVLTTANAALKQLPIKTRDNGGSSQTVGSRTVPGRPYRLLERPLRRDRMQHVATAQGFPHQAVGALHQLP